MKGSAIITRTGLCAAMVCLIVVAIAIPTVVEPLNAGSPKPHRLPLTIEMLGGAGKDPVIVPMGGGMQTIVIKANAEPLGIVRRGYPPVFPGFTLRNDNPLADPLVTFGAFLVFDDPDGCLSMLGPCAPYTSDCGSDYYVNTTCPGGVDESFLEFIPGVDLPGYGGATGFTERLPGLVVLSDTGVGNAYNQDGSLASPRVAFNLASNVGSVAYLFRDGRDHLPMIVATITPPLNAKLEVDLNIGGTPTCNTEGDVTTCGCIPANSDKMRFRIDGGPVVETDQMNVFGQALDERLATCRFFVVKAMNGPNLPVELRPPLYIEDRNQDGVVSADDAVLMGYQLIAGEGIVRFKVVYEEFLGDRKDFDGNGCTGGGVLPASPGGITRLPS